MLVGATSLGFSLPVLAAGELQLPLCWQTASARAREVLEALAGVSTLGGNTTPDDITGQVPALRGLRPAIVWALVRTLAQPHTTPPDADAALQALERHLATDRYVAPSTVPARVREVPGTSYSFDDLLENPELAGDPVLTLTARVLKRCVAIVNEERLFGEPISVADVEVALLGYVVLARDIPVQEDIRRRPPIQLYLAGCEQLMRGAGVGNPFFAQLVMLMRALPCMLVLEPEFAEHRTALAELFENVPEAINTLSRADVEVLVGEALENRDTPRTTMLLGVGRDYQGIRAALARGERVIAVDRDPAVIADLRRHFFDDATAPSPEQLILEEASFADRDFMLRHAQGIDRIDVFFPNELLVPVAAFNLLKPGGVLVVQDFSDANLYHYTQTLGALTDDGGAFVLLRHELQTRAVYETPWGRLHPTGNALYVLQKRPEANNAQRLFVDVRAECRRTLAALATGAALSPNWGEHLEVTPLARLRLDQEQSGLLVSFNQWFESYALESIGLSPGGARAYLSIQWGLLFFWLRDHDGPWPVTKAAWQGLYSAAQSHLNMNLGEAEQTVWWNNSTELAAFILPRHLAVLGDEAFARHQAWIKRRFPQALQFRDGLAQTIDMASVRAALAYERGRDHTVFFLGPGPGEEGLIQDALRASGTTGETYLVDRSHSALRRMGERVNPEGRKRPQYLELDYLDYTRVDFMERFRGTADRVVLLYPNSMMGVMTAVALLKVGGRLILQHVMGGAEFKQDYDPENFLAVVLGDRLQTVLKLVNVRPVIQTAHARAFPAGNLFVVQEKIS